MTPRIALLAVVGFIALPGCGGERQNTPLSHQAYVWQRDWNPAVVQSVKSCRGRLDGLVVLGLQIDWNGEKATVHRPAIDWQALQTSGSSIALAVRIGPFTGEMRANSPAIQLICSETKDLIGRARETGVTLDHVQIDFDCAEKRLAGYALWIRQVRQTIAPLPLCFTALPVWLDEPELHTLCGIADGWVLQAHSVRIPNSSSTSSPVLCDPALADQWMRKASTHGKPFWVALPTYRSQLGVSPDGKVLGIVSEGPQPKWPGETRVIEFAADPTELARLVARWNLSHPASLQGVMWYRLPVSTDRNNWRWPTLVAVMAGRTPRERLAVRLGDGQPTDVAVENCGETDVRLTDSVRLRTSPAQVTSIEALPGWIWRRTDDGVVFAPDPKAVSAPRLPPGEARGIGWLRSNQTAPIHAEIIR